MSGQEMFDVLDEKGNKTGEVLPGEEVHKRELWHGSVHVWIINSKDEILLQFRAADKRLLPSCWDTSAAGHISAGDTPEASGIREVSEEIGVNAREDELNYVGFLSEQLKFVHGGTHKEHGCVYVLRRDLDITNLKIQKDELTKVKWFSAKELREILQDPIRRQELSGHDDRLFEFALNATKETYGK